jgi:hypothetical protein
MGQSPTDRYGERLAGVLSCYDRVMIGPQPTLSRSVGCWCLLAGPLNWGPRPPVARRSRSALATPESGHFSLAAPTLSVGQLCLSHHDIGADQLQSVVDPSASCSQSCWASFISTGFGSLFVSATPPRAPAAISDGTPPPPRIVAPPLWKAHKAPRAIPWRHRR